MNSKDFTRENGTPDAASPWTFGGLVMGAVVCAVLLALFAQLDAYDEAASAELQALALAERQRLTEMDQRPATLGQVRAAYEAGQADAMAAVKSKPQGVALVQACLAMGTKAVQP